MRRVFAIGIAASLLGGCSGLGGMLPTLPRGGGQSIDAAAQNECEDRYGKFGSNAVLDCTRQLSRERKAAAAAPAQAQ